MNIHKEIEKLTKRINKYIYKCLKLPKEVKRFVGIEYSSYHREVRVFYNDKYIGKVDSCIETFPFSKREHIENIIKDYASKFALSNWEK